MKGIGGKSRTRAPVNTDPRNIKLGRRAQEISAARTSPTSGAGDTVARHTKGSGEWDRMQVIELSRVRPDGVQPRKIAVTLEQVRAYLNDDGPEEGAAPSRQAERIAALARSMRSGGQHTAIDAYLGEDGCYHIIVGERRYWAARALDWETIRAKVLPAKPRDIRLRQHVENAVREGFTTAENFSSLKSVIAEAETLGTPIERQKDLTDLVGLTKTAAHRWWTVLTGPEDVQLAVENGDIPHLRSAVEIAQITDPTERSHAIRAAKSSVSDAVNGGSAPTEDPESPRSPRTAGDGAGYSLQIRVTEPEKAKKVYQLLGGDETVDWSDPKAVKRALATAIEAL